MPRLRYSMRMVTITITSVPFYTGARRGWGAGALAVQMVRRKGESQILMSPVGGTAFLYRK